MLKLTFILKCYWFIFCVGCLCWRDMLRQVDSYLIYDASVPIYSWTFAVVLISLYSVQQSNIPLRTPSTAPTSGGRARASRTAVSSTGSPSLWTYDRYDPLKLEERCDVDIVWYGKKYYNSIFGHIAQPYFSLISFYRQITLVAFNLCPHTLFWSILFEYLSFNRSLFNLGGGPFPSEMKLVLCSPPPLSLWISHSVAPLSWMQC